MKEFLTSSEVAKICHVSSGSVVRWIHEGKLKSAATAGGHHRILKHDVIKLLKQLNVPIPKELVDDGRIKVLILDEDPDVHQVLLALFERYYSEMEVLEAKGSFDANAFDHDFKPDLIFLDIGKDEKQGLEICKQLRADEVLEKSHIIVMTPMRQEGLKQEAMDAGANELLAKPFYLRDLTRVIDTQVNAIKGNVRSQTKAA